MAKRKSKGHRRKRKGGRKRGFHHSAATRAKIARGVRRARRKGKKSSRKPRRKH